MPETSADWWSAIRFTCLRPRRGRMPASGPGGGTGALRRGAAADRGSLFAVLHPLLPVSASGRIPGGSSALKPSPGRYLRKTYAADYCVIAHLFRRMEAKYAG